MTIPARIDPGQHPDGVVVHLYDTVTESFLLERHFALSDDVVPSVTTTADRARRRLVVLALYDGNDGAMIGRAVAVRRSGEDRHAPRPHQKPEDDEHHPVQDGATDAGNDTGDHEDHRQQPQQEQHGRRVPR